MEDTIVNQGLDDPREYTRQTRYVPLEPLHVCSGEPNQIESELEAEAAARGEGNKLRETLMAVWRLVQESPGPCLFAVVHKDLRHHVRTRMHPVDGGYMEGRILNKKLSEPIVIKALEEFLETVDPLDPGYKPDCWSTQHRDPNARGQPKDGYAAVFSFNGTVLASACRSAWQPEKFSIPGGCRHGAAVGVFEAFLDLGKGGVVLVRSEARTIKLLRADSKEIFECKAVGNVAAQHTALDKQLRTTEVEDRGLPRSDSVPTRGLSEAQVRSLSEKYPNVNIDKLLEDVEILRREIASNSEGIDIIRRTQDTPPENSKAIGNFAAAENQRVIEAERRVAEADEQRSVEVEARKAAESKAAAIEKEMLELRVELERKTAEVVAAAKAAEMALEGRAVEEQKRKSADLRASVAEEKLAELRAEVAKKAAEDTLEKETARIVAAIEEEERLAQEQAGTVAESKSVENEALK